MSQTKLWGGVFDKVVDDTAWRFGQSLVTDLVFFAEEIEVSVAHAAMLGQSGIVSIEDADELVKGLRAVYSDVTGGLVSLPAGAEDLHGAVEALLCERVGPVALRLHAGRSRNDQVTTATRLWTKRRSAEVYEKIQGLQQTLLGLAEEHSQTLMPGYTHQQPAQPITLGLLLLAYFWMLERDKARFSQVFAMADECPLGAAALAGTTLPIDRGMVSSGLGFERPTPNALDAVSDRDFVCDALHACALLMQHLSRVSQEIVLFSTREYGFVQLDEACSTGSSIMPQKRNPDFAELIRGRSSRAIGNWVTVMTMMKALPLGYNRDQQEDKPPLFDSVQLSLDSLSLTDTMLATATFHKDRMSAAAATGFSTATAVAEALVAEGIPFRAAHEKVGGWVKSALKSGKEDLSGILPENEADANALALADPMTAMLRKGSQGATSPAAMHEQILLAKTALATSPAFQGKL